MVQEIRQKKGGKNKTNIINSFTLFIFKKHNVTTYISSPLFHPRYMTMISHDVLPYGRAELDDWSLFGIYYTVIC